MCGIHLADDSNLEEHSVFSRGKYSWELPSIVATVQENRRKSKSEYAAFQKLEKICSLALLDLSSAVSQRRAFTYKAKNWLKHEF
jgi:hypothetical protein